jgi:DNA-directed RNA polymerase omega subunit
MAEKIDKAQAAEESETEELVQDTREIPEVDSKYRLIFLAAQRSKQLQRGATPRVDIDGQKHKATRIALEEVRSRKIHYDILDEE